MTRTRTLAPLLGLTALATTLLPIAPVRAQTYNVTVTDLTPPGPSFNQAAGYGISGSTQAGYAVYDPSGTGTFNNKVHDAVLWTGSAASLVDLNPAGFNSSQANGISGSTQVGSGLKQDTAGGKYIRHALLWHGTAASVVDLNPAGFGSEAFGVSSDTQVGDGNTQNNYSHALLWHGTADSVIDLNPAGFAESQAVAVSGDTQVGNGDDGIHGSGQDLHALLWHGTAGSVVDLTPAAFVYSQATGVSGDAQVGYGYPDEFNVNARALLWHGTAGSVVVLDTPNLKKPNEGFNQWFALAVSGGVQVGSALNSSDFSHAILWRGTGASAIDLDPYIPYDYRGGSVAYSVEAHGNVADVVGVGTTSGQNDNPISHAFLWHIVFQDKSTVTHLYPASRTAGEQGFVLTVKGTGFTPQSYVTFNGVKLKYSYFTDSFTLTASIRATLITQPGTSQIAVFTPGAGTSNSHVLTIMPRPTLTGLSPTSKAAGSAAFTLTVNGTGFRPASFYAPTIVKWNGTELTTTYVSATKLTAAVPASLLTKSGKATVTVTTPQVATSAGQTFTITP